MAHQYWQQWGYAAQNLPPDQLFYQQFRQNQTFPSHQMISSNSAYQTYPQYQVYPSYQTLPPYQTCSPYQTFHSPQMLPPYQAFSPYQTYPPYETYPACQTFPSNQMYPPHQMYHPNQMYPPHQMYHPNQMIPQNQMHPLYQTFPSNHMSATQWMLPPHQSFGNKVQLLAPGRTMQRLQPGPMNPIAGLSHKRHHSSTVSVSNKRAEDMLSDGSAEYRAEQAHWKHRASQRTAQDDNVVPEHTALDNTVQQSPPSVCDPKVPVADVLSKTVAKDTSFPTQNTQQAQAEKKAQREVDAIATKAMEDKAKTDRAAIIPNHERPPAIKKEPEGESRHGAEEVKFPAADVLCSALPAKDNPCLRAKKIKSIIDNTRNISVLEDSSERRITRSGGRRTIRYVPDASWFTEGD